MMFGPHSFEVAKILGAENINKLSGYLVFELLRSAKDVEETAKLIGSENIRKLSDKNIYDLIHIAKNKDEMTQVINKYKAN